MSQRTYDALVEALREFIEESQDRPGIMVTDFVIVTCSVDPALDPEAMGRLYLTIVPDGAQPHNARGLLKYGDEHIDEGIQQVGPYDYGVWGDVEDYDDDEDDDAASDA